MRRVLKIPQISALLISNVLRAATYFSPTPVIAATSGEQALLIWMIFVSLLLVQNVFLFGLPQIFIRAIGSVNALSVNKEKSGDFKSDKFYFDFPDQASGLNEISLAMKIFFYTIAAITTLIAAPTWFFLIADHAVDTPYARDAAWAWVTVSALTILRFEANRSLTFLHGSNDIFIPRFLDSAAWLSGAILAVVGFLIFHSLTIICIALHLPLLFLVLVLRRRERDKFTAAETTESILRRLGRIRFIFFFAPAWRSGLGLLATSVSRTYVGILLSSNSSAGEAASFLFALNLYAFFSMAGSLPVLVQLQKLSGYFQSGEEERQFSLIRSAIFKSMLLTFIVATFGLVLFAGFASVMPAEMTVNPLVWFFLSLSLMSQRLGAGHLSHYSVTNHVVIHIVDISSTLVMLLLIYFAGLSSLGISISMFLSSSLVYLPLSLWFVWRRFGVAPIRDGFGAVSSVFLAFLAVGASLVFF